MIHNDPHITFSEVFWGSLRINSDIYPQITLFKLFLGNRCYCFKNINISWTYIFSMKIDKNGVLSEKTSISCIIMQDFQVKYEMFGQKKIYFWPIFILKEPRFFEDKYHNMIFILKKPKMYNLGNLIVYLWMHFYF